MGHLFDFILKCKPKTILALYGRPSLAVFCKVKLKFRFENCSKKFNQ